MSHEALIFAASLHSVHVANKSVVEPKMTVSEGLSLEQVNNALKGHIYPFRKCLDQQWRRNEKANGTANLKWIIDKVGHVSSAQAKLSGHLDATMRSCLTSVIKSWQFPKPQGGKEVHVTWGSLYFQP